MKFDIECIGNFILLNYETSGKAEWINEKIDKEGIVPIKNHHFHFHREDIKSQEYDEQRNITAVQFIIGRIKNEYYEIPAHVFQTDHNILIHKDDKITKRNYSIIAENKLFKAIEYTIQEQVVVGGENENAIPIAEFINILNTLPTKTEISHYKSKRISNILGNYFDNVRDYGKLYENYLKRTGKRTPINNSEASIKSYEREKYTFLLNRLQNMLDNAEGYSEDDWQKEIASIITILYPKYIRVIEKLTLYRNKPKKTKWKEIDITLLDINGNIDILEIKKPELGFRLLNKTQYRNNYVLSSRLSGTIMQIEKYIFHLNRLGDEGIETLKKDNASKLLLSEPSLKITNPKGLIIYGRNNELQTELQKLDFEVLKRKFSNIMDIITYDDLLERLRRLIEKFTL